MYNSNIPPSTSATSPHRYSFDTNTYLAPMLRTTLLLTAVAAVSAQQCWANDDCAPSEWCRPLEWYGHCLSFYSVCVPKRAEGETCGGARPCRAQHCQDHLLCEGDGTLHTPLCVQPKQETCTLQCGTVVANGWMGNDEGTNDCNMCNCINGGLACTKMGCPNSKECPKPEPTTCTLGCGTVVPVGWGGNDEGDNACNTCSCTESGHLICTLIACPDLPCPTKKSCELQCGTVVADGWTGKGEGTNDCNTCSCRDGGLACTKMGCPNSKECPKPEPTTCTLGCGTVVPVGWSGNDEGDNACNTCSCTESGHLICTLIACPDLPCPTKKSCELQCGTVVADGWTGKDVGPNHCRTCSCHDGGLACTKMECFERKECPKPEPTTCTLGCGTVVPVGWGGNDEGDNACNTCSCTESGHLICTLIACPDLPCPTQKSCELQCGTVVADGWTGKGEGTNDCNTCSCRDGGLACTKMGCPNSKECPKPEPTTCTLGCGTVVPVGWSGHDEGDNACNTCSCTESGHLICTLIACPDLPCPTKKSCELQCGTVVADGWTGKDVGPNHCRTCSCHDGGLACTKMECFERKECPKPEPTTCTLGCGTVVPVGWSGNDEGDNACNTCGCMESGLLRCTLIACPDLPCPTKKSCELQCGTVVADGWSGKDVGPNHCRTCSCHDGGLACTKMECFERKECPKPEPTTCTLGCGTVVPVGWSGNDEGDNACNTCSCTESGHLICTLIACPDLPCPTKKSCELQCGTVVADGWTGKDVGPNHCRTCSCHDGGLACTKMECFERKECPKPEPTTCTLGCGTVVPVGWGGNDEGDNACNTCGCMESGLLRCTLIACPDLPCPAKKSCELQCGTVVADGWTGKDEGTNDCNTCSCRDGGLACTKMGCPNSKECPKPEPTTCTLGCGTVVPVGWSGHDEGDNACNTCGCMESGLLRCTLIACPDLPCPAKKSCELQCGTVVADGWTGKGEGTNDCNTCSCNDGALGCTKIACLDSLPCL